MKQISQKCLNCDEGFKAKYNYAEKRYQKFCSVQCAAEYRFKKPQKSVAPANPLETNGHLTVEHAQRIFQVLHNFGFLTRETIESALRRATDKNPVAA